MTMKRLLSRLLDEAYRRPGNPVGATLPSGSRIEFFVNDKKTTLRLIHGKVPPSVDEMKNLLAKLPHSVVTTPRQEKRGNVHSLVATWPTCKPSTVIYRETPHA